MKNQKESQGEDNNFSIGIMPNSRVKRTSSNQEDLKFLMCFDYYKRNLTIEDAHHPGEYNEGKEISDYSHQEVSHEKKNISLGKNLKISKTKLSKKTTCDNFEKINNLNKKEFFKIEKKDAEECINEYQKELVSIMNDNNEFINIYTKNNDLRENVDSIFEFLHHKKYSQEVCSIISLFDLPNFMQTMDGTLKMWNEINSEIVNLL